MNFLILISLILPLKRKVTVTLRKLHCMYFLMSKDGKNILTFYIFYGSTSSYSWTALVSKTTILLFFAFFCFFGLGISGYSITILTSMIEH